ncbi:MAG: PHP domain-containing protein [Chloroherpetonaceae bacterium]|nr:PHP domain-containing protein [Chloroherpetonaceae bacterium]
MSMDVGSAVPNGAVADLHMHTTCSDGALMPLELVEKAYHAGLHTISITDHDNFAAIDIALERTRELGMELVPGVEVSTSHEGRDIHVLGYYIDYHHSPLVDYLAYCRKERLKRADRIVENLKRESINITVEQILKKAGNGSVGRPHIAAVLQEQGYVQSFNEAFNRYIGTHCESYEKGIETAPAEVIRLINEAGGLSVLAHPGRFVPDDTVRYLIDEGLDGMEIVHPSHNEERREFYRAIANEYFLVMTGGADYHGVKPQDDENFGKLTVPYSWVQKLKNRLCIA